jgi:hypothetical protein
VWLVDWLIVALLAVLVVLELLRPLRLRRLLNEVDRRVAAATDVLDRAQQRMEGTLQALREEQQRPAPAPQEEDDSARRPARGAGRGHRAYTRWSTSASTDADSETDEDPVAEAGLAAEDVEREVSADFGEEPQAHFLRDKIAGLLESSGGTRTERERRLLRQLDSTLEMTPGPKRYYREKALYAALKRAAQEAADQQAEPSNPGGEPPQEERELIAKLRGRGA